MYILGETPQASSKCFVLRILIFAVSEFSTVDSQVHSIPGGHLLCVEEAWPMLFLKESHPHDF